MPGQGGTAGHSRRHWLPVASVDCGIVPAKVHFSHSSSTFSALGASSVVILIEAPLCVASRPPTAAVQSGPAAISVFRAAAAPAGRGSATAPFTAFTAETQLKPIGIDVSDKCIAVWDAEVVEVHSVDAMRAASVGGAGAPAAVRQLPHSAPVLGLAVHHDLLLRCARGGLEVVSVENGAVQTLLEIPPALGTPLAVAINGTTAAVVTSALHVRSYALRGRAVKEAASGQIRLDAAAEAERLSADAVSVGALRVAPDGAQCAMLFVPAGAEAGEGDMLSVVAVQNMDTGATMVHGADPAEC